MYSLLILSHYLVSWCYYCTLVILKYTKLFKVYTIRRNSEISPYDLIPFQRMADKVHFIVDG